MAKNEDLAGTESLISRAYTGGMLFDYPPTCRVISRHHSSVLADGPRRLLSDEVVNPNLYRNEFQPEPG